ncbi:beta-ketoacyl synthase N-terminal-like domain-containing protein [Chitiniphilus eburneus]|uniref:beta-ketoacyl synthase N-terminal-like domain-containing protein n=1 Tax=Chitiniphilus eburneus TaxID=2571148 RepID=UPI0035D08393
MHAELVITGAAALSPYGLGVEALIEGLRAAPPAYAPVDGALCDGPAVARVPDYDARELLATRSVANFDRLTLHVCAAATQLHQRMGLADTAARQAQVPDERVSLVLGSSGPLQSVLAFDLQAIEEPRYVQPSIYPNVVFNVPASYAAIRHTIRGSCITLTDGDASGLIAFSVAAAQLESGRIDLALVGAAEEATPAYALYRHSLAHQAGVPAQPQVEGAALLALETAGQAQRHGRATLAGVFGCAHVYAPGRAEQGLAACLDKLRRRFGTLLDEVGTVALAPELDAAALGLGDCRRLALAPRLGASGTLYGAFAVLDALADTRVAPGELMLVLQGGDHAPCAALLLQKHQGLMA